MCSFGHKTCSFRHNLNGASNPKDSLTKVVRLDNWTKKTLSEHKIVCSFRHKMCSFCHNLNGASNQKDSLTKVVHLYNGTKITLSEY